nr:MAG TPA: hypothetical protein [Caudoviricetes sp.]
MFFTNAAKSLALYRLGVSSALDTLSRTPHISHLKSTLSPISGVPFTRTNVFSPSDAIRTFAFDNSMFF